MATLLLYPDQLWSNINSLISSCEDIGEIFLLKDDLYYNIEYFHVDNSNTKIRLMEENILAFIRSNPRIKLIEFSSLIKFYTDLQQRTDKVVIFDPTNLLLVKKLSLFFKDRLTIEESPSFLIGMESLREFYEFIQKKKVSVSMFYNYFEKYIKVPGRHTLDTKSVEPLLLQVNCGLLNIKDLIQHSEFQTDIGLKSVLYREYCRFIYLFMGTFNNVDLGGDTKEITLSLCNDNIFTNFTVSNALNNINKISKRILKAELSLVFVNTLLVKLYSTGIITNQEALFIFCNFCNCCFIDPKEIFLFLKQFTIGFHDWFLFHFVFSMGTYSDGGHLVNKAYIVGPNYISKNFSREEYPLNERDTLIMNALYYNYIIANYSKLLSNRSMFNQLNVVYKTSIAKKEEFKRIANEFILTLT